MPDSFPGWKKMYTTLEVRIYTSGFFKYPENTSNVNQFTTLNPTYVGDLHVLYIIFQTGKYPVESLKYNPLDCIAP